MTEVGDGINAVGVHVADGTGVHVADGIIVALGVTVGTPSHEKAPIYPTPKQAGDPGNGW